MEGGLDQNMRHLVPESWLRQTARIIITIIYVYLRILEAFARYAVFPGIFRYRQV